LAYPGSTSSTGGCRIAIVDAGIAFRLAVEALRAAWQEIAVSSGGEMIDFLWFGIGVVCMFLILTFIDSWKA
jgi:hypothetical protein